MRILVTVDPDIPIPPVLYGGIERIVDGLVCELRRRGNAVALAAHPESTVAVDQLFAWPGKTTAKASDSLRNALAVRKAVRSFGPDLVHSFSRLWHLLPILRRRLPKIMSYQRYPSLRNIARINELGPRSLQFTGCSEYVCGLGRTAGGTWSAIHNFVDLEKFTFVPQVPDDAPLVFLSRVETVKGPDLAIEAAKRAGRRLIIAGNHSDTPNEAEFWRTRIEPHLGKDGIEYVGPVNDQQKNELLGRAAAMIVPIRWNEPFGIVFAEALACGTPVISSPNGALPEIIRQGQDGFLTRSADELVDAIGQLKTIDRCQCRQRVEQSFSARVVVDQYERLYRSMIDAAK